MNEQKNLLLAIVASLIILLIFQYFFPNKPDIQKAEYNNISVDNDTNSNINKIFLEKKL